MKYLIFILSLFTFSVNAQIIFPFVADSKLATQNVTATTTLTDWNKWVGVGVSASTTVTLPTAIGNAGKQIVLKRTDNTGNTVTIDPAGSETIDGLADMSLTVGSSITVYSDGVNCYVSTTASPSTTPLIYGRVNASTNLTSKSFVSTGVGTTVDFTASVYSSGMTFSGTNGITPSVTGRYRASYYINAGSDETANNATIRVVQGGVSLGSVYINQHNSAGSVNQTSNIVDFDAIAGVPVFLHYQPDVTEAVAFDQGSYFQLTQLPTAVAPVVNTVAEYGENNSIVGQTVPTGASYIDVTGSSFTLPTTGIWEVEYFIQGKGNANGAETQIIVTDALGNNVGNSQSMYSAPGLANVQMTLTQKVRITNTGSTQYKLQIRTTGATFTTQNSNAASGVLGGNSKITYTKIAGQLPSTGTTVDYVNVYLNAGATVASNATIPFNTVLSGNIPYNTTTGEFTLTAGKTYSLRSNVNTFNSASALLFSWYNQTTNAIISPTGFISPADHNASWGSNQAEVIFTPTVATVVTLRNTGAISRVIPGAPFGGTTPASQATIVQLGSTSNTVGTLPAQDQSSTGYFDIGNMRMQWGIGNTSGISNVTLPSAFANTSYAVTTTLAAGSTSVVNTTGTKTTTTFQVNSFFAPDGGPSGSVSFNYFAIGQKP